MAIGPRRPDGEKAPPAPLSQWTDNVRDAVRKNIAQQSTRDNYYRNPAAFGGDPNERDPRGSIGAPPPQRPPYVPPSALERWQQEREEDKRRQRREGLFREFSDDAITSLDELLMPQFGLPARPNMPLDGKQPFEVIAGEPGTKSDKFELTPEQQDRAEKTRLETRRDLSLKQDLINDIEKVQAQDTALPDEERKLLQDLRRQLLFEAPGKFNELDPLVVTVRNLGTRSEFRKKLIDWKSGKVPGASAVLPWGLDTSATGEEIDEAGGLGGFMQQSNPNSSNFDGTPNQFGFLLHTDENGLDHIVKAEEWINLKLADVTPSPGDSREEKDRKAAAAADLISTLAFADKYNSFAKKRDAGYRIELDAAGNPIRAYIHNDDKVALTNLVKDVLAMQEAGVIAPVDEFMKVYADERRGISETATGVYGDGSSDRSGGGGFYRGGGGGYYGGGGGGGGGVTLEDPELLKMSVDSIARARMGRSLTVAEAAEFVAHYHSMQQAFVAARQMGADAASLDPEAQAVAWIESRMVKESAGQQAGNFVAALAEAMRSGRFSAN